MEIAIVITLAAGVVKGLAWLQQRLRRRRTEGGVPLGQASIDSAVPTFRIVSLGLQGAGKTLLLASMFHELQAPTRQSYYLSAAPADVAKLTEWFATMADTTDPGGWPAGTTLSETRRFAFTVKTRTADSVHDVLRLDYLEYAGELLTRTDPAGAERQAELFAQVQSADAVLGILDGQRIRQHLDGEARGWAELDRTLNILIPHMMNITCPISFVLTKWDLLADLHEDEDTRLARVRDLLMANGQFRALVNTHGTQRVVRLIPVSAVGRGFATIDQHGHVVKVPSAQAQPTYADVPLSAVVPDVFDQAEMRLHEEFTADLDEEIRQWTRRTPLERLSSAATLAGQSAGRALLQYIGTPAVTVMGDVMMGMFLDSRRRRAETEEVQVDRQVNQVEQRVQEFLHARRRVLRDMRGKPDQLEGRLPSSRLTAGL
ncbi:hypothetical protein [Acrocarpospora sp. B8E8]|uniref:TRAFAC clade GTPase domain-containing protein n=1 Tax=Acrocarpospora sp. B8E8 TaxID=3153572 RepID=UPI00325D8537